MTVILRRVLRSAAPAALLAIGAPVWAGEGAGGAHVLVGGELSGTISAKDRGYFNTADYGEDVLRLFRARLTLELRMGEHLAALSEVRHTNEDHPQVYALYLRFRPWSDGPLDIQAGMVPPVFGAFPRRLYATDNPLIGLPLGYQYLTSLRTDSAPRTVTDLLTMRGRGWFPSYPVGTVTPEDGGVPLVETERWDTGVEARLRRGHFEAAASLTQGSPSAPRLGDDNDGKSLTARVSWEPVMGLVAGVSGARGRYLDGSLEREIGRGERTQQVWGADLAYARGHWILRAEGLRSSWQSPFADPTAPGEPLTAWAAMLEARLKVAPGWSIAGRADRLAFGTVGGNTPWEYPITRLEGAVDWTPQRHLLLKLGVQHDRRSGGSVPRQTFIAAQAVVWF